MVEDMKRVYAHESDGALVVDVKEETDTKEVPPCMILKSDGDPYTIQQTLQPLRECKATIRIN